MRPNHNHRTALPISAKQRTVIMIICTQFGISKAERGQMLQDRYGKSSTADLSSDQAGHFIKEFEGKGFVLKAKNGIRNQVPGARKAKPVGAGSPRPIPRTGNVIALATRDELEKIIAVATLIEWRVEGGLQLFLEKRMGIKGGTVRTQEDSWKAIEGLKKTYENQMKAKHGPAWWRMDFGSAHSPVPERSRRAVQDYVDAHCPLEWR